MRSRLANSEGTRKRYTATFLRTGKKKNYNGYSEDTILLVDVREFDSNTVVADHLWFAYSKVFQDAQIREGMRIEFEARVKTYSKGYVNKSLGMEQKKTDYKLSHPTKIKAV
jgi:hypothetical protein